MKFNEKNVNENIVDYSRCIFNADHEYDLQNPELLWEISIFVSWRIFIFNKLSNPNNVVSYHRIKGFATRSFRWWNLPMNHQKFDLPILHFQSQIRDQRWKYIMNNLCSFRFLSLNFIFLWSVIERLSLNCEPRLTCYALFCRKFNVQ